MALTEQALTDKFIKAYTEVTELDYPLQPEPPPSPGPPQTVANIFSNAYVEWVRESNPLAGIMSPVIIPGSTIISTQLSLFPLFSGWGLGIFSFWTAVIWKSPELPPLFTGVTIAPPLATTIQNIVTNMTGPHNLPTAPKNKEESAQKLAKILFAETSKTTVMMTNVTSGITSVVKVV